MALQASHSSISRPASALFFSSNLKALKSISLPTHLFQYRSKRLVFSRRLVVKTCVEVEEKNVAEKSSGKEWGKVSAVLFDMDGVLCNSEELSRRTAVDVLAEMGVQVTVDDFVPFMGTDNRMQGTQPLENSAESASALLDGKTDSGLSKTTNVGIFSNEGLQGSRRDTLRFGSLAIAISCLVFTFNDWKAMQYASPKAIWNLLFGVYQPSMEQEEGNDTP